MAKTLREYTDYEKQEFKTIHTKENIAWLEWIIKNKTEEAEQMKDSRFKIILLAEIKNHKKELNSLLGFSDQEQKSNDSKEVLLLKNAIVNKQILLTAHKTSKSEYEKISLDLQQLQRKLNMQLEKEGRKELLEEVPF